MIQADAFAFKVDMKDDIVFNAGTVEALPVFWDGILVHQILVHDAGNGLATRFMTVARIGKLTSLNGSQVCARSVPSSTSFR